MAKYRIFLGERTLDIDADSVERYGGGQTEERSIRFLKDNHKIVAEFPFKTLQGYVDLSAMVEDRPKAP